MLCTGQIRLNFIDVDKDIAKYVSHRLFQHKITVIQPDRVQDWLDRHDDWDKPDEIGEATGATHVVFIDVHKYNLFEENSHDLFRGRAEVLVSVFKMQKGDRRKRFIQRSSRPSIRSPRRGPRRKSATTASDANTWDV